MRLDYRPSHSNENLGSKDLSSPDMVDSIFSSVDNFETLTQPDAARRNGAIGGLDAIDFPAVRLAK
jgi:hypothetical protein